MITLFASNITDFTTNGLGSLAEAISCLITEELNGQYELEMTYPITGRRYADLVIRRIIFAKPNPHTGRQAFRIYKISKPINGIITINAEHYSYDMTGYPVEPFYAATVATALSSLKEKSIITHPFTFWTDKTNAADLVVKKPSSTRALLGKEILETYGGEYEFDNTAVKLWNQRGTNRGVSIRYGKNLTDLRQEENCSTVYTSVYPYWFAEKEEDEEDVLFELPEKYLLAPGNYDFARVLPLDLSSEWEEQPTEEEMRVKAIYYMQLNGISLPRVALSISFVKLTESEEYKDYAILETVFLGDTINVYFPKMDVNATARCVRTIYDAITDKYNKIELGHAFNKLASSISSQNQLIKNVVNNVVNKVPSKSFVQAAIENATKLITGGLGGHVILRSSNAESSYPDEILIMDTEDITTASNVWRWNVGGLGHSSVGYNGPYTVAMTMDGAIVADTLTGRIVAADTLSISGNIEMTGGSITWAEVNAPTAAQVGALASTYIDANNVFTGNVYGQNIRGAYISTKGFDGTGDYIRLSKQFQTFCETGTDLIKMGLGFFPNKDNVNIPGMVFGAGDGYGSNRGYITKDTDGLSMYYVGNLALGEVSYLKLLKDKAVLNGYEVFSTKSAISDAYISSAIEWNEKLSEIQAKAVLEDSNKNWNIPQQNLDTTVGTKINNGNTARTYFDANGSLIMSHLGSISWSTITDKPTIPTQYTDNAAVAAWAASGYKTYIDANGVYSGNLTGMSIYVTGVANDSGTTSAYYICDGSKSSIRGSLSYTEDGVYPNAAYRVTLQSFGTNALKLLSGGNTSIDAGWNKSVYIGTQAGRAEYVQIGNDVGGSVQVVGPFYHGAYTVIDSGNIGSYVVFQ